jgi:radical SAM protein with 4Fe4S-binding SPASM domain
MLSKRAIIYRDNWIPNYQMREGVDDNIILINPAARWCFVSQDEYKALQSIALPIELFNRLEQVGVITTNNNAEQNFNVYKHWNEKKYSWPSLHIIETTKACNLSCLYCHMSATSLKEAHNTGYHLSNQTMSSIVDKILSTPVSDLHIEFQGGESLLNFSVLRYGVLHAKERASEINHKGKITFSIVTNLTLLREQHCEFFAEHDISVCTTLDGPKFIHDANRITTEGKGSFDAVCKGIQLMDSCGLGTPAILTVVTAQSAEHIPELVHMFKDIGATDLSFIFVHSMGRGTTNWNDLGLNWELESKAYTSLLDSIFELWKDGIFVGERMLLIALEKLFGVRDTSFTDFRNPCGMARGQIAYDAHGAIYTCDEARSFPRFQISESDDMNSSISQNIVASTIPDIVDTPQVDQLLSESLPNYKECEVCAYRPICGLCPVQRESVPQASSNAFDDHGCHFTQFIFDYCFKMLETESDLIRSYNAYNSLHHEKGSYDYYSTI